MDKVWYIPAFGKVNKLIEQHLSLSYLTEEEKNRLKVLQTEVERLDYETMIEVLEYINEQKQNI